MSLLDDPQLQRSLALLTGGMLDYLVHADSCSYTEEEVDRCRDILTAHAEALDLAQNREEALKLVQATVERLNHLNEGAGGELIETDQREEICDFLTKAGAIKGFNGEHEDVTEPWRQW